MEDLSACIQEVKEHRSAMAFYKIVQAYEARVFTMCYRIIGNREEAEEAAQDVFMSCFKSINTLDDNDKFLQWILRISYHKSIDYIRKRKVRHIDLDSIKVDQQVTKDEYIEAEEGSLEIYLSFCDKNEKAILMLYYQEEMSIKEIAETLNMTISNVKIKLFRARNKIKKSLESKIKNKKS